MNRFVIAVFKAACLAVFAAALARLAGWLPQGLFVYSTWIAAALLVIHAIEVPVFYKHIRLYRGPLVMSVLLTLLFGLLHWKPLADAKARVNT
jgi:hypothetical protein